MYGVFKRGREGPHTSPDASQEGRKQEQQQRRMRGYVSRVSTEEDPHPSGGGMLVGCTVQQRWVARGREGVRSAGSPDTWQVDHGPESWGKREGGGEGQDNLRYYTM